MATFLGVITVLTGVVLLLIAAIRPLRTPMSRFELDRRVKAGDSEAQNILRRETLLGDILSLQRIIIALLLVILTLLLVAWLGWVLGIIVAVVCALEYGVAARLPLVKTYADKLYAYSEPHLLQYAETYPSVFKIIRSITAEPRPDYHLESREQLLHLVAQSGTLLSGDEKRLVKHGLEFEDQLVSAIMTPSSMIDSISKTELLGPLVLNDLHKTGHSRFPVIDGDIDHVVGMVYIRNLLTAQSGKGSTTVEKAMEPRVFYIREDQTLHHALAAFLRTHHHLFIVVNEFRETVGLVSLEDVIEALLGRKIVDEFDAHEDLRAVAARNPRKNNNPPKHTNV